MSTTPPFPLRDHCSVIYNHTLYVYSPEGFQSLRLTQGGRWTRLPYDLSIRGAKCVKAIPHGDESQASLYIVGGATNGSKLEYSGLQRYRFADSSWSPVKPSVSVTQNRRNHGAVFLNGTTAILTYAGSQDTAEAEPSSQTFLLSLDPPYTVTSYSSKAPPLVRPMLFSWTEREALMVGGDANSRKAYIFSQELGWTDATFGLLDRPIPDDSKAQAIIVDRSDGSKILETFHLSTSPNTIDVTVLQPGGNCTNTFATSSSSTSRSSSSPSTSPSTSPSFASPSTAPSKQARALRDDESCSRPAKRRRRDGAGASDHPIASPTIVRTGFSLAKGSDGLVVISGGNDQELLSIFDVDRGTWVNTTEFLGAAGQQTRPTSSSNPTTAGTDRPSSSTTSTSTASPSTSGDAASSKSDGDRHQATRIFGAIFGSIVGVALLLGLILLLRWRRRKRLYDEAGRRRRDSGAPGHEKNRLSFADRGASFMSQAAGVRGHEHQDSSNSTAILTGQGHRRDQTRGGGAGMMAAPEPVFTSSTTTTIAAGDRRDRSRSSGWSRYFLGNPNVTDLAETTTTTTDSDSPGIRLPHHHPDQLVDGSPSSPPRPFPAASTPINFSRSYPSQPMNNNHSRRADEVVSPSSATRLTAEDADLPLDPGMVQRFDSSSSSGGSSSRSTHHHYGGHPGAAGDGGGIIDQDSGWSPVAREEWSSCRAPSSVYTISNSARGSGLPRDFNPALFPQVPRDSTMTAFPGGSMGTGCITPGGGIIPGVPRTPGTPAGRRGGGGDGSAAAAAREVVVIGGMGEYDDTRRHSGMSWLNLGNSREGDDELQQPQPQQPVILLDDITIHRPAPPPPH